MPRPRKDYVSITGRVIAGGGCTQEEVDFVREKLKTMNQATLLRQAISIYYKYETGQIFQNVVEKVTESIFNKVLKALKSMDIKEVNELITSTAENDEENTEIKQEGLSSKERELLSQLKQSQADGWGGLIK